MPVRLDLRLRIALAIATVCIAAVAALGVTLYTTTEDMEAALVDQIVTEEIDHFIERVRSNPEYKPAAGPNFEYYVIRPGEEPRGVPPELRALPPGNQEARVGGEERHVAVRQSGGTRYIVAYDVGPHEDREQRFKAVLLLSLLSVAAIGMVLGYWLAGILTRQLTELAQRVSQLSPGEEHAPLAHADQDPEVAALAGALDAYQLRIARMVEREQEFTANASHELRTPLTAIGTSCELLLADPALSERARARVVGIEKAVRRMTEELQSLLFIAREQTAGTAEDVALAECVADAAEPYRGEMVEKGLEFEVAIEPEVVVRLNRHALETVLANLIRNAVQHTEHGAIRVSFDASRLVVADTGRGIPRDSLPRIFERFYRAGESAEGFGLGLAIVKRICDHYGWRVDVESSPATGSHFSIRLA